MKALIVGGGITGLATAIVLSRQGVDVDLIERQAHVNKLGSGITLIGAALRAFDRLGVYEECVASGYSVSQMEATFSTGERRDYDLVIAADGLRSTVRDLILGPLRPDFRGQGAFRIILPRPAELRSSN